MSFLMQARRRRNTMNTICVQVTSKQHSIPAWSIRGTNYTTENTDSLPEGEIQASLVNHSHMKTSVQTRIWANAQRDGRPAQYVAPSVQRCKVCLMHAIRVKCSNTAKMRNRLKFAGVPQTANRSQALVG